MNINILARIISHLTGMHVLFPVLLVLCLTRTGLSPRQIFTLAPLLFFFSVVVPIAYILSALYLKKISAWDLPKREERHVFFLVGIIANLFSVILVYLLGTQLFFHIILILFCLMTLLGVITWFWKISLHTSLTTVCVIVINFFYHWHLPFLYLFIPLVIWARFTLKRHTPNQMLAGIIISALFLLGALHFLGYM